MSVAKLLVCALKRSRYSSLIWVVSLVLQMCERRERACSKPIQLVLKEHDLLLLLLDYVQQFALVGNLCNLGLGV